MLENLNTNGWMPGEWLVLAGMFAGCVFGAIITTIHGVIKTWQDRQS